MIRSGFPIIFGEVLFDVYDEKVEKLGGAPFNVARHLEAFGLKPLFISKIGSDARGKTILSAMNQWQMSTQGLVVDPVYPTGMVSVTTEKGVPQFSILPRQAYDYIEYPEILKDTGPADFPLLYHGTLATRWGISARTLQRIRDNYQGIIFVDLNLRNPWWNKNTVINAIHQASWLKCNEDEFKILKSILHINSQNENQAAEYLLAHTNWQVIIITRGEKGAVIYTGPGQKIVAPVPFRISVLDSVGAGDALSAVIITGILNGWDAECTLQRGVEFAAQICQIKGAIPEQANFYQPFLKAWNL
jgi:fructokinase